MAKDIYQQNVILPTAVANYNKSMSPDTVVFHSIKSMAVPYEVIITKIRKKILKLKIESGEGLSSALNVYVSLLLATKQKQTIRKNCFSGFSDIVCDPDKENTKSNF